MTMAHQGSMFPSTVGGKGALERAAGLTCQPARSAARADAAVVIRLETGVQAWPKA
jgi:hypothetical protein